MAQIISGGSAAVQALLYGDVHPGTDRFFESQRGQALRHLTETARSYIGEIRDRFGYMATDRMQRAIRDVRRKATWAWHGDFIRPLRTLDDFQMAPPCMLRFIMAEPYARTMYHQQSLAGYDEDYTDLEPGRVGEDHHDYRVVMDGIVQVDEEPDENGDYHWHADTWIEDYAEDEAPMDFRDQIEVMESWGHMRRIISERLKDPTSVYHASLE
jgi:hypothetical protein